MLAWLARPVLAWFRIALIPMVAMLGLFACSQPDFTSRSRGIPRDRLSVETQKALEALPEVTNVYLGKNGNVIGITGRLGKDFGQVARVFNLKDDQLVIIKLDGGIKTDLDGGIKIEPDAGSDDPDVEFDEEALGSCETTDQTSSGIAVEGGECKTCRDPSGEIVASFCEEISSPPPPVATVTSQQAVDAALAAQPLRSPTVGEPQLTYLMTSDREDEAVPSYFAWKIPLQGAVDDPEMDEDGFPGDGVAYVDANTSQVVAYHSDIQTFRMRLEYSAFNRWILPGFFRGSGPFYPPAAITIPDPDPLVNTAYINSGWAYAFFRGAFGRNSFNGFGADMISTVRYGRFYSDAFWNMRQTVFGDGNGVTVLFPVNAREVVIHEWTHGVTQYTARLAYRNESGALNEGWSDIMGITGKAWSGQGLNWIMGQGVSANPRRMNNPTLDGHSTDFYAERYRGLDDYGGVHSNSGIANLAYYLIVAGGNHPRPVHQGVPVQAQGLERAARIFYHAYRYMNSSCNFRCARRATVTAAQRLYGNAVAIEVGKAWTLVGVP